MIPHKPANGLLKKIAKILLFIVAFLAIALIILGNIGGNDDHFKKTIEGFASDASGYNAHIAQMNNMRFFPNIVVHFNTMRFFDSETPNTEDDAMPEGPIVAQIGQAHMVMSFWDVLGQNGRFKYIFAENIRANPGIVTAKALDISTIQILENTDIDKANEATLNAQGHIGEYAFNINAPLQAEGLGYARTYRITSQSPITITLGELNIIAHTHIGTDGLYIDDLNITNTQKTLIDHTSIKIEPNRIVFNEAPPADSISTLSTYLGYIFALPEDWRLIKTNEDGTQTLFERPIEIEAKSEQTQTQTQTQAQTEQ